MFCPVGIRLLDFLPVTIYKRAKSWRSELFWVYVAYNDNSVSVSGTTYGSHIQCCSSQRRFLDYELLYQLDAIEYLLCSFSSTCFGLTRRSSGALDVKFLTYTAYGVLGVVKVGLEECVCWWRVALQHATSTHTPQDRHLTTPRTPYAVYVKKFNIHCS